MLHRIAVNQCITARRAKVRGETALETRLRRTPPYLRARWMSHRHARLRKLERSVAVGERSVRCRRILRQVVVMKEFEELTFQQYQRRSNCL